MGSEGSERAPAPLPQDPGLKRHFKEILKDRQTKKEEPLETTPATSWAKGAAAAATRTLLLWSLTPTPAAQDGQG